MYILYMLYLIFHHLNYSSLAKKRCNSVLIDDVFYLLVVTSNVLSFGRLVEVVVMSHLPVLLVKGKSKHSAVNKIYALAQKLDVLKYAD